MKRTPFKPGGGLSRSGGPKGDGASNLRSSSPKSGSVSSLRSSSPKGGTAAKKPAPSPFEQQREAAKRAALNALKRARRAADKAGVSLSEWEGEFIDSVSERVKTHGRAFADPEKGAPGQALSAMQGRKLKEITAKANGVEPKRRWGRKPKEP
ncbi:hypothetical protein CEP68_13495 [Brevundimonas vesicularis]|uniref:Uncharacterized protein n=1 Tax=Brevundimonas vesicularis TaxID=41276 RepID=A0A1Z3UAS9_BREVE|nr:hypothetical protein CEP68_13495 [Brevundimonas vesicularis]